MTLSDYANKVRAFNFSGIFILSIKADTRNFSKKYRQIFLLEKRLYLNSRVLLSANLSRNIYINEIGTLHIITEWLLLFFAKFLSHRLKNEKVMTENLSQLDAPVLMTEPPYLPVGQIWSRESEVTQLFANFFILSNISVRRRVRRQF